MDLMIITIALILIGIATGIVTYLIPYCDSRKNILVPVKFLRSLKENTLLSIALLLCLIVVMIPGTAVFVILTFLIKSIWIRLIPVILNLIVVVYFLLSLMRDKHDVARTIPARTQWKWFYEVHLQNIMKTTETYPVRIILKPTIVELNYGGIYSKRLLVHIPLVFDEEPIAELSSDEHLHGEIWTPSSSLTIQVNAPAFQIDPKELCVALGMEPTSVEFLVTPSKPGKHLLAVEFHDEAGRRGYLRTSVRVKDFVLLGFIRLTNTQIKVIRGIGYIIGIVGVIVSILNTIGLI